MAPNVSSHLHPMRESSSDCMSLPRIVPISLPLPRGGPSLPHRFEVYQKLFTPWMLLTGGSQEARGTLAGRSPPWTMGRAACGQKQAV